MALLTIILSGTIPVDMVPSVMEDLRAVAVKLGCPTDRVRTEVRWQGAGHPADIIIRCVEQPVASESEEGPR